MSRLPRVAVIQSPGQPQPVRHYIGGHWQSGSGQPFEVESPYLGECIGHGTAADASDIEHAASHAAEAARAWRALPIRERVQPLMEWRARLHQYRDVLARTVALESGKTQAEAEAGLMRGLEVIDFATSLPNTDLGGARDVSRGVSCEYRRVPLGVVGCITPFNFPAMVPLWMLPIALATGNSVILKPSEKVPLSAQWLVEQALHAGLPPGVLSLVHGGPTTAHALIAHPLVRAIGFVGSSAAAHAVYEQSSRAGKRALCLGGAKNHLIVLPDADPKLTVQAVVDSFTGCAGQRCMAGSVLIAVGKARELVPEVVRIAGQLQVGYNMGALIDRPALDRLLEAILEAERQGVRIALDGRNVPPPEHYPKGYFLGPTILDNVRPEMRCAQEELFGPVLSVIHVADLQDALAIENRSPYGNATSVFTRSGEAARLVAEGCQAGMVGINVGVPVPRDPFSFGGTGKSKFGHGDMTGAAAVEFWTDRKKITQKWALQSDATWMS